MATMRPPAGMSGTARWASRASARALVSRHQRQCLSDISSAGLSTPEAALLTRMSRRSKCRRELGEELRHALGLADVGLDRAGAAPRGPDRRADRLGLVVAVEVVDRHVAARRGQLERDGATDAPGGPGDQRDLSRQRAGPGAGHAASSHRVVLTPTTKTTAANAPIIAASRSAARVVGQDHGGPEPLVDVVERQDPRDRLQEARHQLEGEEAPREEHHREHDEVRRRGRALRLVGDAGEDHPEPAEREDLEHEERGEPGVDPQADAEHRVARPPGWPPCR